MSLEETAKVLTASAARSASLERYAKLSRKIHALADGEIKIIQDTHQPPACRAECNYCCHNLIGATLPEIIEITEIVRTWSPDEKEGLADRLNEYTRSSRPYWHKVRTSFDTACPFLKDSLCTIYESRPLQCRSISSYDAAECQKSFTLEEYLVKGVEGQEEVCRDLLKGTMKGFRELHLPSGTYELGPAVNELLTRGGLELSDEFQLTSASRSDQGVRLDLMPLRLQVDQNYDEYQARSKIGPISTIFELEMPAFYESQDQLEDHWQFMNNRLDRLCDTALDPKEAFQALHRSKLFYLPYAGKDVRPFLQRFMTLAHEKYAQKAFPDLTSGLPDRRKPGPLRVGYLSTRLTAYNGSRWALGWLPHHSPEIETYAFNLAPREDLVSMRWRRLADHYYHLPVPSAEVAEFVRPLDLDVMIFTDLGEDGTSLHLALFKLARTQMTAWGRAVTSGSPAIDFYLSSEDMEPSDGGLHYSEQLVRLPGSAQHLVFEPLTKSTKSASELGLPQGPFYFIAQNPSKLVPNRDEVFAEITSRSGKPIVFCEHSSTEGAGEAIKSRMRSAGVNVHLLPRLSWPDFLRVGELSLAVLDTFDFSGGMTTIELLTTRCPVVTCPGPFMRGRMAIPFLNQSNAPGLITKSISDYVSLACDPDRIAATTADLTPGSMYGDLRPIQALDAFLLNGCSPERL